MPLPREVMKMEYIIDDIRREATYQTRKNGMMKKMENLSILCGNDIGAIFFSDPFDSKPEVWPNHEGVQELIHRFGPGLVSERAMKVEEPLQNRIEKGKELLIRMRKENREEEIFQLMIRCMKQKTLPASKDWHDVKMLVEKKLKIMNRMATEYGKEVEFRVPASSMVEELPVPREIEIVDDQFHQQLNADVPVQDPPTFEGAEHCLQQSNSSTIPYIPNPPTSPGLEIYVDNENLTHQHLQYGMDLENMEDLMDIGACEIPQSSNNTNYPYVPSFYNPFS